MWTRLCAFSIQVNFLSHFYLTNLIIQRQSAARRSTLTHEDDKCEGQSSRSLRVVNVASTAYSRGRVEHVHDMTSPVTSSTTSSSDIYQTYADSKLAMMLFTTELNFREATNHVVCLAAHPGISPFSPPLLSVSLSLSLLL